MLTKSSQPARVVLYETTLKVKPTDLYSYPIRLFNSPCLYEMTFNVKAIVRVKLLSLPSQLMLIVRDNSQS
jgi:hypothetical protein